MEALNKLNDLWWEIKYYCWDVPQTWYYDVKWFFKNLWRFREHLWKFRTWDFSYCNELFADSLDWLADTIDNGHEERVSATKKVASIHELTTLLRKLTDDTDFDTFTDPTIWDSEDIKLLIPVDKLASIQERRMYTILYRILRIIRGQDSSEFSRSMYENYDEYVKQFDGTGYFGWWD